jgi:2-methylfumaryl-CoA isomerase
MPVLSGLKIVEVSAFVAAPLAGATLAGLGAEVIRVEPPGGGIDVGRWPLHRGRSLYRAGLDQGKRSVVVDTRTERGRALVAGLVAHAGIFLTNLPVGEWSAYERLRADRPDLIMAVLTGDPDGTTAVDYTVNAAIGVPWITGPEGADGPVNHVLPAWDIAAGYTCALGILAAALRRATTGRGELITLSLFDVAAATAGHLGLLAEAQLADEPRARYGNHIYGAFGRDFRTADGATLMVVALTPRQWRSLVDATDTAEAFAALEHRLGVDLSDEAARFRARDEICAVLQSWFGARRRADVETALRAHNVLWGPYQTAGEFVRRDPRFTRDRAGITELDVAGIGRYRAIGSPLAFGAQERPVRPPPALGEHTAEVLSSWLGLTDTAIEDLRRGGVIAS